MRLIIEKRDGDYYVQLNENEFVRQSLNDALANVIEPEYLDKIADLVKTYFETLNALKFTLNADGGLWCVGIEVNSAHISVEKNHPITAIVALATPVILSNVAQMLKQYLP